MYKMARTFLNVSKWIWLVLISTFVIALVANLAVVQTTDLHKTVLVTVLNWFALFGLIQTIILIAFGMFIVLTLVSLIITMREGHARVGKVLKQYLRAVEEAHKDLNPKGFAQQSVLISPNVPLDAIFIHLNAISDRPLYDLPYEQQKLLEELRLGPLSDMAQEQREEHIKRQRVLWHSQLGLDWVEIRKKQNVPIEEILKALNAERPVAIILGTPGSGKSTTMRWLALEMARASLSHNYDLPEGLAPRQIPILIHISDYAKGLDAENMPFRQYLTEHIARTYPTLTNLSNTLLDELKKGHCLLLFDGLVEVASDSLRMRVAENVSAFISDYDAESATTQHFNRFIVTSRIVGYEVRTFNRYAHYTLRDLEDEQIKQFLINWCPAVERYQAMASQGMKPLTAQQKAKANKEGDEQRDRLLEALDKNPSIKRLAVNPLMLTILTLIQRSGKTLPQRRIELYKVVTRTLLDDWNKGSGKRVFSAEEIPLAEQLLGDLAYRLQSSDPVLTEQDVKKIASHAMDTFYQLQRGETKDAAVQEFIETLRSSSGLFVESGQGLFSFMLRTFQEYYAALYLLRKPQEELKQFVIENHTLATWHEPLLLAIADKSIQWSKEERRQASDLIEAIANTIDDYESILQRSLLFAANCIVNCSAWSINALLQINIAYRLFGLYGDSFGSGRYTQLQQEIEEVALFWLRGLPLGDIQQDTMPPILKAWRGALINNDESDPLCQIGAVHLLASIAPDLPSCPKPVLHALVPLLLQLAGVQDWYKHDLSCPPEIRAQLFQTIVHPCSLRVEEYALVALRLLEAAGPAGWLHADWRKWGEEQPELLELLTRHSLEIDYLFTPVALPASSNNPNWDTQLNLVNAWKKNGQHNSLALQAQLLQASDTTRYPHAYLFDQLLENELASPATSWHTSWDIWLQKEMSYEHSATYQTCLNLRLLLCRGNEQQRREIANELVIDLSKRGKQHTQALISISNLYVRDMRDMRNMLDVLNMLFMRDDLDFLNVIDMRYRLDMQNVQSILDMRNMLKMRKTPDMEILLAMLDVRSMLDMLNKDQIIGILNNMLKQQAGASLTAVLFALYSVLRAYNTTSPAIAQQVHKSIQVFQRQKQLLSVEERQLTKVILRQIGISPTTSRSLIWSPAIQSLPHERAMQLHSLKQQDQLRKGDVEEILAACMDTREISEDNWGELLQAGEDYSLFTVREFAWRLLSQPPSIDAKALPIVAQALNDSDVVVCAAAALLLQNCKKIPPDMRKDAAKRIIHILSDDELSGRLFDPPGEVDDEIWRLDDVLFETLKVLAE